MLTAQLGNVSIHIKMIINIAWLILPQIQVYQILIFTLISKISTHLIEYILCLEMIISWEVLSLYFQVQIVEQCNIILIFLNGSEETYHKIR